MATSPTTLTCQQTAGSSSTGNANSTSIPVAPMTAQHQLYIQAATSDNTRRTYRSAIRHFHRWGGALPCQSDTMIHYLLAYADQLNPRTLEVRLTALSQWHRYQGFDDPAQSPNVRKTLEGIKRKHGCPKRKAVALRLEHLAAMIDYLNQPPQTKKKARDLALLLIGFFGGFRRSELVAMETAHLQWEPEGIIIELPRSKTDQEGQGIKRAIPYGAGTSCPVHALKNWLEMAEIQQGVIFKPVSQWDTIQDRAMSPGAINNMLKVLGKACQSSRVGPHGTDPLTPRYVRCRIPRFQTGV